MNTGILRFPVNIQATRATVETAVNIATHPTRTGKILINIPGLDGSVDGYEDKYLNLANEITAQRIASVIRVDNTCWLPETRDAFSEFEHALIEATVRHANEHSTSLCKSEKPKLYAAATSASTPFALSLAAKMNFSKLLLIAPIGKLVPRSAIAESLRQYSGDITIVFGTEDRLIDHEYIEFIRGHINTNTTTLNIKVLDNCDHQFSGERNQKRLQRIYINAFRDPINANLRGYIRSKISPITGIWPFAKED